MSSTPSITIWQNYWHPVQKDELDPDFTPHDNTEDPFPELRELYIIHKMYNDGVHLKSEYTGLVSQRFFEKTGLKGEQVFNFIRSNPGYDVYLFNPVESLPDAYAFKNVWMEAELRYPGIISLAHRLFVHAKLSVDLSSIYNGEESWVMGNFWVGNRNFWDQYFTLALPVFRLVHPQPCKEIRDALMQYTDPERGISYLPFIFERLCSTILAYRPEIRKLQYCYKDAQLRLIPAICRDTVTLLRKTEMQERAISEIQIASDVVRSLLKAWLEERILRQREGPHAVSFLKTIVRLKWREMAQNGIDKIAVFGAGKHTRWLLWVLKDCIGPHVVAILDDDPEKCGKYLHGIPIYSTLKFDFSACDALVLGTDSHVKIMRQRARDFIPDALPIINLYEDLPPGPYMRDTPP